MNFIKIFKGNQNMSKKLSINKYKKLSKIMNFLLKF
jgi:hypothetical protein